MKHSKLLSAFTIALLGLSSTALSPTALEPAGIVAEAATEQTFTDGVWEYSYISGTDNVKLTKYLGNESTLSIPAWAYSPQGWKTVTIIGSNAFRTQVNGTWKPKNITSVIIPNTVRDIESSAFKECPLKGIVIPSSVTVVRNGAFRNCSALKTVEFQGNTHMFSSVFKDCTALKNLIVPSGFTFTDTSNFSGCHALNQLNSSPIWYYVNDANNRLQPVMTSDNVAKMFLKNNFGAVSYWDMVADYCTALCDYVVATETRSWMSDAVKARQLFKWLIDNCHYEPDHSTISRTENQCYASVFLSYGLDGEGESVCTGYSKAYTMLLAAAGIESYLVHASLSEYGLTQVNPEDWGGTTGHMWNLVYADGKYYQCDVSSADLGMTGFQAFMMTDIEMYNYHSNYYTSTELSLNQNGAHPYLDFNAEAGQAALSQCVYSFNDSNVDGILDFDFDFNGTSNDWHDQWVLQQIANRDMNLDGHVDMLDRLLYQLFCQNGSHEYWLRICISLRTFGN